jgi:hypothetical protein
LGIYQGNLIIEGKDIESEKHGSLLTAAADEPNSDASVEASVSGGNDWEYITGLKLILNMIPLAMVRNRTIAASWHHEFIHGSYVDYKLYMAIYSEAVEGATPTESGIHCLPSI